jgi:hypothetical protein
MSCSPQEGVPSLFWKRPGPTKKETLSRPHAKAGQTYRIDYDMMLKGSYAQRGRTSVRQTGVSVNGSTRIVTSGDEVDRATYEALLAAGAIQVAPSKAQSDPPKDPPAPQPTAET